MHTLMRITPLALAALAGTAFAAPPAADEGADVQALANQLAQLKANYAQEVRRLRELDMQVQAMQARLAGRAGPDAVAPAAPLAQAAAAAVPPGNEGYASSAAEAQQAKQEARRSVDDVKQQQSALFSRRFTIENSLTFTTASSSPSTASWHWTRSSSATSPSRTSNPIRSPTTWPPVGVSART